jgi:hypothetical protein
VESWEPDLYHSIHVSSREQLMHGFHLTCGRELVSLGIEHIAGRERFVVDMSRLLGAPYYLRWNEMMRMTVCDKHIDTCSDPVITL